MYLKLVDTPITSYLRSTTQGLTQPCNLKTGSYPTVTMVESIT